MKDDIEKQLNTILMYLESDDINDKIEALRAFEDIIEEIDLEYRQIEPFVQLIQQEFKKEDSNIRTDLFRIACKLGKINFDYVKEIYPVLTGELTKKNNYRIGFVLDLLASLANTNRSEIFQTIEDILSNGKKWFDTPQLIPQFYQFFQTVTDSGFKFISKFESQIHSMIEELPQSMSKIKELLEEKVANYHDFKEQEKKRREAEREMQVIRERKAEIIEERKEHPTIIVNGSDESHILEEKGELELEKQEEKQIFSNFTKYGLRRKDPMNNKN